MLDNAESFWFDYEVQSCARTILRYICSVAQSKLEEVHSEFVVIGNRLGATQCLQSLGKILRMQDQDEEARLKLEAHCEFIIIGDRLGAAQCLQSLSNILRVQDQYEEAQLKLEF